MKLARVLYCALTLSGLQDALHGAVFAADFPDTGHGLRDRGPAGGSAVGGVNALAGAVDDGRGAAGSRFTVRCSRLDGSRGSRRDVAGGADLGESDFELALDLGFPGLIHGGVRGLGGAQGGGLFFQVMAQQGFTQGGVFGIESAFLLCGRAEDRHVEQGNGRARCRLEEGGLGFAVRSCSSIAGGRLLGLLGLSQGADDEEQGGEKESFHEDLLARVAVFGKVGKGRGSVKRHHRRNDEMRDRHLEQTQPEKTTSK